MSAPSGGPVRVREDGGVVRVELDRPPVNVLDGAALEELEGALGAVRDSDDARLLLLSGRGRAFCAGVAVEDHLPDRVRPTVEALGRVVDALLDLPFPVVAAVHGATLGGGCELALACDIVVARTDAVVGQPEIRLGVFPPVAAALMPRLLGSGRALELILTGRRVDAREAREMGLVHRVFPVDGFDAEVEAYVDGLAGLSRPVLRLAKRAVLESVGRSPGEAMRDAERLYLAELMDLDDPVEGLTAFLEERKPEWRDA